MTEMENPCTASTEEEEYQKTWYIQDQEDRSCVIIKCKMQDLYKKKSSIGYEMFHSPINYLKLIKG